MQCYRVNFTAKAKGVLQDRLVACEAQVRKEIDELDMESIEDLCFHVVSMGDEVGGDCDFICEPTGPDEISVDHTTYESLTTLAAGPLAGKTVHSPSGEGGNPCTASAVTACT